MAWGKVVMTASGPADDVGLTWSIVNRRHFHDLAVGHSETDHRRLGWSSRRSQRERFRELAKVGDLEGVSVLDVGCGTADFKDYLSDQGIHCEYWGIDLINDNIRVARSRFPESCLIVGELESYNFTQRFDYVVSSGVFGLDLPNWEAYMKKTLATMFQLSKIGVATNFLSARAPLENEFSKLVEPSEILSECFTLTSRCRLHHDYSAKNNDFTVFLYR
jgi:ubiquinone/menaquinone biosynthesis C-methylase UbiE